MKVFNFTLTRTRLQSMPVKVTAENADDAEEMMEDLVYNIDDSDHLKCSGMEFGSWSHGEDEGDLDYDMEDNNER